MVGRSAGLRILGVAAALTVVAGALAACSSSRSADPAPDSVPRSGNVVAVGDADAGPGAFIIRYADAELRLAPTRWALDDESSKVESETPPSVGGADELYVFVPVPGWQLGAFTYTGSDSSSCDSVVLDASIEDLGGGWSVIRPLGSVGTYILEISAASGPLSPPHTAVGEMTGSVIWDVSNAKSPPPASASMSFLADIDGTVQAWDLSVEVADLYPPTADVSATVTVTSAQGRSATFHPQPQSRCRNQSAFLSLPADQAQEVLSLGTLPYTYTVELVIDGKPYVGTAEYTTGPTVVPLAFTPALP